MLLQQRTHILAGSEGAKSLSNEEGFEMISGGFSDDDGDM